MSAPTINQCLEWLREAGQQSARDHDYRGSYDAMPSQEREQLNRDVQSLALAYAAGRAEGYANCRGAVLEQRCERNTPWDMAIVAAAAAIERRAAEVEKDRKE